MLLLFIVHVYSSSSSVHAISSIVSATLSSSSVLASSSPATTLDAGETVLREFDSSSNSCRSPGRLSPGHSSTYSGVPPSVSPGVYLPDSRGVHLAVLHCRFRSRQAESTGRQSSRNGRPPRSLGWGIRRPSSRWTWQRTSLWTRPGRVVLDARL